MKVIVCGDRYWSDKEMIKRFIASLPAGSLIIQGECMRWDKVSKRWVGADFLAKEAARELGYPVTNNYAADWKVYGGAAGPIRNRRMLKEQKPDLVVAFHDNIATSKGTKDMLHAAKLVGVEAAIYSHNTSFCVENSSPVTKK